jgi:hypothetical protein
MAGMPSTRHSAVNCASVPTATASGRSAVGSSWYGTMLGCVKGHRDDPTYADVIYVERAMYRGGWHLPSSPLSSPFHPRLP